MRTPQLLVLALIAVGLSSTAGAADPALTGEDRIREALRDNIVLLRSTQADLANLQAEQAATADEKKALAEKLEALKKQVAGDRVSNDKIIASFSAQLAELKASNGRLKDALDAAKAEGEKASAMARDLDSAGSKLKSDRIYLERKVADLQTKNLALFMTGNEILSRYAEFSLGNAIGSKEPFVSLTRTKLENLVQDYQDQLLDQRAKP